jgi:DNA-binding transcriptional LysR family regulator
MILIPTPISWILRYRSVGTRVRRPDSSSLPLERVGLPSMLKPLARPNVVKTDGSTPADTVHRTRAADGPPPVSTNLEFRHLRAFVAVAEELHFTRAAHRLHVAQQALSAQIQQLERELGTPLFTRTTRKVELTDAGRTLLSHAMPILASVSAAYEETQRAGSGEIGRLTIAYTPTIAHEALPLFIDAMHARFPGVQLRTLEMWQADAVAAVEDGRFDVGMARVPSLVPGLGTEVIRMEAVGVILGAGHRLTRVPIVEPAALSEDLLMIWPREFSPGYYQLIVDAFRAAGFTGAVREFENLTPAIFFGDVVARIEVAALRAFAVGLASEPLPAGFVWRPLSRPPRVPLNMFWKDPAGTIVENFRALAREVAAREGWVPSTTDTGD